MRHKGFTCTDCGGYAPPDGQGQPMWPGPRCTRCACQQYAHRHGCSPVEAEHHLYQQRVQQTTKIR